MLTISFDGDSTIATGEHANEIMADLYLSTETRRASHVVPENSLKHACFRLLRWMTGDGRRFHRLHDWTRTWKGQWKVDLRPSGGPVVGGFLTRQRAITWEQEWLSRHL